MHIGEAVDETVAPAPVEDAEASVEPRPESTEPVTADDSPRGAAARVLETAATTADELVANAREEAESLVTNARAEADALLAASRTETYRVQAELARNKEEQAAELDKERATALAGLAEEKAFLESQIATLRRMHHDHSEQMRSQLTRQLELLERTVLEPPGHDAP